MAPPAALPYVGFSINLAGSTVSNQASSTANHLLHLFESHRLAAVWGLRSDGLLNLPDPRYLASQHELAVVVSGEQSSAAVTGDWFQKAVAEQLHKLSEATGAQITTVFGNAGDLRNRTALLESLGITAVVSHSVSKAAYPRSWPCGLWQLAPTVKLPARRGFWQKLSGGVATPRKLVTKLTSSQTAIVSIELPALTNAGARGLRSVEHFLAELTGAASRRQLQLGSLKQIVSDLNQQRAIKPQRSILRSAA